jgi:hypothetical protein
MIAMIPNTNTPIVSHGFSGEPTGMRWYAMKHGGSSVSMPAKNNPGDSSAEVLPGENNNQPKIARKVA